MGDIENSTYIFFKPFSWFEAICIEHSEAFIRKGSKRQTTQAF